MRDPELEAFARRCEQIYEARYKVALEATHLAKFVAVEPDSEDYYLGETLSEAVQACRRAYPDRLCHVMLIGAATAFRLPPLIGHI